MTGRVRERTELLSSWWSNVGVTGSNGISTGSFTRREKTVDNFNANAVALNKLKRLYARGKLQGVSKQVYEGLVKTEDFGSEFHNQKNYMVAELPTVNVYRELLTNFGWFFRGSVLPDIVPSPAAFLEPSSDAVLFDKGAHAIGIAAPNNPHAGLAVALVELREGLPTIPGIKTWKATSNKARLKEGAGEYLNFEFGWKPMVSDIKDAYKAITRADTIWSNFVKNAERPLHRGFHFTPVTSTVVTTYPNSYGFPVGATQLYERTGTLTKTVFTSTEQWFEGVFRYAMPEGTDSWAKAHTELEKLRLIYGLDIDPVTIWNVLPWSWLVDWVADMGPLLKNLSLLSSDGLVMQYGYIMEHKTEQTTWSLNGLTFYKTPPVNPRMTLVRESKVRLKATPYGFGLKVDAFTPRQWAILTALGISRHA